nr:conserved hypothetical protein [Vibrio chagasii]
MSSVFPRTIASLGIALSLSACQTTPPPPDEVQQATTFPPVESVSVENVLVTPIKESFKHWAYEEKDLKGTEGYALKSLVNDESYKELKLLEVEKDIELANLRTELERQLNESFRSAQFEITQQLEADKNLLLDKIQHSNDALIKELAKDSLKELEDELTVLYAKMEIEELERQYAAEREYIKAYVNVQLRYADLMHRTSSNRDEKLMYVEGSEELKAKYNPRLKALQATVNAFSDTEEVSLNDADALPEVDGLF